MKLTKSSLKCHSHKDTSLKSSFCFHLPHYPYSVLVINPTKASACNTGDLGSISGSGRSLGEGNGNPLRYCCLGNPMDTGAWWATVHGVAKSQTGLSDFTFTFTFILGHWLPTALYWFTLLSWHWSLKFYAQQVSLLFVIYILYTNDNFSLKTLLNFFTPKHFIVVFIIHLLEKLQIFKLFRFGILELQ